MGNSASERHRHERRCEMAIANFQRTVYHSGGNLATGRVQYITRTGPYQSQAEARVLHQGSRPTASRSAKTWSIGAREICLRGPMTTP